MSASGNPSEYAMRAARYLEVGCTLEPGDSIELVVAGDCMAPFLQDGQRVRVMKQVRYWPGDIVAFTDIRGRLLIHRYLGPAPAKRIMTAADAGPKIDVLVPVDQVLGKALLCEDRGLCANAKGRVRAVCHYGYWVARLAASRIRSTLG